MTYRNRLSPYVSRAGLGKPGYCRLCSFTDENLLNDRLAAGWNAAQINRWLDAHYQFKVNRQTIYRHRDEHIGHPEDRLVTAVEKTKALEPSRRPRRTTNEQFLEAIRDAGHQRAVEHPDEVTIQHALEAAKILTNSRRGGGDQILALVQIFANGSPVIEGEAVEVTEAQ